ncbi:MAG TPA: hypothetical protein VFR23_24545 [Jiangellaceae bacterium]|nr:hypothetical protein [Jiangellaceae bacterium]
MATPCESRRQVSLSRRLRLEYNLDRPEDVAAAMREALAAGASDATLEALRFRMARSRRLPELGREAAWLVGR